MAWVTGERVSLTQGAARRRRKRPTDPPLATVAPVSSPRTPSRIADGLAAGALGALLSGAPSAVHALLRRGDVLEATTAAGSLLLPRERRTSRLVLAAIPVHLGLSLGWGVLLSALLPRRATAATGALAGLAIAAVDLGLGIRRFPRIRRLALGPQLADHLAYGLIVGAALARRRRGADAMGDEDAGAVAGAGAGLATARAGAG